MKEAAAVAMKYDDYNDSNDDWQFPLLLSCLAGASTCVGASVVFIWDAATIERSMSFSLSLAASVMITVSVISIGPECWEGIVEYSETQQQVVVDGYLLGQRLLSFGLGCFSYWMLSKLLEMFPEPGSLLLSKQSSSNNQGGSSTPSLLNGNDGVGDDQEKQQRQSLLENSVTPVSTPSKSVSPTKSSSSITLRRGNTTSGYSKSSSSISLDDDDGDENGGDVDDEATMKRSKTSSSTRNTTMDEKRRSSWRVAMLLFFSLLFHNFPEGLAVVASTVESRNLGVTVAIGILIHNIPEGIAIAVPCIAAKPDSKWLAFWLASGSGLAEPMGAIVALKILKGDGRVQMISLENILAYVAGIMCMVAMLELYPEARKHRSTSSKSYSMTIGTICGMTIMIATEWYLVP